MRFAKGEFYHIYNRGVEGRDIFLDDYDYKRFMHGLSAFNVDALVRLRDDIKTDHVSAEYKLASVLSYVLMKNHVHLLVRCNGEARLSQFLQKLFGGYTMYFNVKYSRKGVLFQGKSKSKHIDDHRYLAHLVNYIHLNPLDYVFPRWREHGIGNQEIATVKKAVLKYPYSSVQCVVGETADGILDQALLRELFPEPKEVFSSMVDWSADSLENTSDFIIE